MGWMAGAAAAALVCAAAAVVYVLPETRSAREMLDAL